MANLNIELDTTFETTVLQIHDEKKFEDVFLSPKKSIEFFSKVPKEDLSFEVVSTNEDAEASFPFFIKNGGKEASFLVTQQPDGCLRVSIKGKFALPARSGADKMLKKLGNSLDLRIRGVMWKGGTYNGFMAWVKDSDYEQVSDEWFATFPKIQNFSIK